MPPKVFTYKTPDGKEFTSKAEYRDYMMANFFSFKEKKNEPNPLMKVPGDIDGQVFDIADCENSTLVVMDKTEQVQIDNCKNCRIFIGACSSSIFARNCENCVFYTVCRQLRLREVTQSTFYIYSQAEVHIEFSNTLRFAPFNGGYPMQGTHMQQLSLPLDHNLWYDIFDHNDQAKTRVNWSLLPIEEYEQPWFPMGVCEPAIKLTAVGSVQRDDGQVGQSFGVDQMIADSKKNTPPALPPASIPSPIAKKVNEVVQPSFFNSVPLEPPNSILGVALECKKDPFANKIDLTIGAYRTDAGVPHVLDCVREAEIIIQQQQLDHEYLSQDGHPVFTQVSQLLMFGEESSAIKNERVYTIQSISGTGSLRLATEFIAAHMPSAMCYIPSVSWQNHATILQACRVKQSTYRYLDSSGCALDFDGLIEDISQAVEGSVILLHNCAHNPTGVDPTDEQWKKILEVCQSRKLFPFFDNAYQGFVTGDPATDAYAVRLFSEAGMEMLVACSFAKNFGLYGERVGALHIVVARTELIATVSSQLRALARSLYSTCPSYGARIVALILSDPVRKAAWVSQCKAMADRINESRNKLFAALVQYKVKGTWSHVTAQRGMFSYTGIPAWAVQRLKDEYHCYMLSNGRISLAGLNSSNIEPFAQALATILGTQE